jgi:hypothetical protein
MKTIFILLLTVLGVQNLKAQNSEYHYSNQFNFFLDSIERLIGHKWYPIQKNIDTVMLNDFKYFVTNQSQDIKSHFLLMILAESYPNTYNIIPDSAKITAFCNGFSKSNKMNYWSILKPNTTKYGELEAGKLLVDLGRGIVPCMSKNLMDTMKIDFGWNFDSRAISYKYKWRRKDFAYRYCALALGETPIFLEKPEERDMVINKFIKKYKKELVLK